jgi:hypothetical protein
MDGVQHVPSIYPTLRDQPPRELAIAGSGFDRKQANISTDQAGRSTVAVVLNSFLSQTCQRAIALDYGYTSVDGR